MDNTTIIYIAIGFLMVAIGFYIVWQSFKRQKHAQDNFDELSAANRPSVVPRDERIKFSESHELPRKAQQATHTNLAHADPAPQAGAADSGDSNDLEFEFVDSTQDADKTQSAQPTDEPQGKAGVDALGDTLSSLEHATADIMPNVQAGEVEGFEGESAILDDHLRQIENQDKQSALQTAQEVVSLTLLPNELLHFDGDAVLEVLSAHGLKFGEMNLFHRHEQADGQGELMFSVMKHTKSGDALPFDLQTLSEEAIDGLTFFLPLPHPKATAGLSAMLSLSGGIARDLNATVYDEDFDVFDRQKRDAMAQYVHEYAQNQLP